MERRVHADPPLRNRCRTPGWRRAGSTAALALLLRSGPGGAAAYLPGAPEAEGPAATPKSASAPAPAESGIQWTLAPVRTSGTVSLDLRRLRLEDGTRSTLGLVYNDIEFATHVWQPWFVQLGGGIGALAAHDTTSGGSTTAGSSGSTALTGRLSLGVFPLSRFPFELRADVSDSRVRGDTLATDYRSERVSLSQSWRPEVGSDVLNLNVEHSRLRAGDGAADTVSSVRAGALRELRDHSLELTGQWSANRRNDSDDRSDIRSLAARHTFHPASALHVDTLATWNDLQLRSGGAASAFESSTDVRQLSSVATWRPREGEWLHTPDAPLVLSGSARIVDARVDSAGSAQHLRTLNASLGASQELAREWRVAGSVSGSQAEPSDAPALRSATANASVSFTPLGRMLGGWRYAPSLGANVGLARSSEAGERRTLGAQAAHGVTRSVAWNESDTLSFNLAQSAGALHDSQTGRWTRALTHSAGVFWQGAGDAASQSYASASASDSRSWAEQRGSFQLVNLQLSRRQRLSRHASTTGNLTLQATRSDSAQVDVFTGAPRPSSPEWQQFHSGSLSYEHQRAFDVPRLRYTALLALDSQQLERRFDGNVDAPRERISASLENRLDYAIGRLETRLSARWVRFDDRRVATLFAHVQRRY